MSSERYTGGPVRFRPPVCHHCRLDLRRVRKADEWEDKFSDRETAKDTLTCTRCREIRTWWWFCFLPITADEVARFLARSDRRRELAEMGMGVAEQNETLQLEDGL